MANSKTSELAAKRWAKALMELALEDEGILYACKKVTVRSGDLKEEVLFYEYIEDVSSMKLYTQEGKWEDQ